MTHLVIRDTPEESGLERKIVRERGRSDERLHFPQRYARESRDQNVEQQSCQCDPRQHTAEHEHNGLGWRIAKFFECLAKLRAFTNREDHGGRHQEQAKHEADRSREATHFRIVDQPFDGTHHEHDAGFHLEMLSSSRRSSTTDCPCACAARANACA